VLSKRKDAMDIAWQVFSWLVSGITITACIGIIIYIIINGYKHVNIQFLITEPNATFKEEVGGGISTAIAGTLLLTVIGIAVAFPWALATAVYLSEYAGRQFYVKYFKLGIDALAGIPTVVIAIFGLAVFSNPVFGFMSSVVEGAGGVQKAFGRSFLVAGITMAVMILPFVIKTCEEAIKAVPCSYREGSLAMGASKWHTIVKIVLPSAKNGIITGIILGMGRIIGDTAIVIITLGATLRMTGLQPWWRHWVSTLKNTGLTLTSYIYYTSPAGEGNMPGKSYGASFVLIAVILVLNLIAGFLAKNKYIIEEE
jgi:phosphate transport system permease protein